MSEKSGNSSNIKFTAECSDTTLNKIVPVLQRSSSVSCFYVNPQYTVTKFLR